MSKLHDDLINEIEPSGTVQDGVNSAFHAIANRIEACNGDRVRLSDLCSILREDTVKVADAIVANTPEALVNKTKSTPYDAPSPAFDRPRQDVRPGMLDSPNEHREQQFPATDNTEAERERIEREQTAKDRGQVVTVTEPMPDKPKEPAL